MRHAELVATHGIAARFKVHARCLSCLRESTSTVDIPAVDDAPTTVEEFLESAALSTMRFQCAGCDSPIAAVVGVTTFRRSDAA